MLYMLSLAVVLLLGLMLLRRRRYNIPVGKAILIMVLVAGLGILSTQMLYLIENGEWGGMSFFGAVLFLPLIMTPIALLLHVSAENMMDFIAPPGLLMFAVMKTNCFFSGCCGGRVLTIGTKGATMIFPSQLVEAGVTIVLILALLLFEYKEKTRTKLYPISMVSYGILRFILNWFRMPGDALVLGMQKGTVWSVVAVIIGVFWLMIMKNKELDEQLVHLQQKQLSDTLPEGK